MKKTILGRICSYIDYTVVAIVILVALGIIAAVFLR